MKPEQLTANLSCRNTPFLGVTEQVPSVGGVAMCSGFDILKVRIRFVP